MNPTFAAGALLVGLATGAVFAVLRVPIPAPPTLPDPVGISPAYIVVHAAGVGFDFLRWLGLS